jgi:hypothetical protein
MIRAVYFPINVVISLIVVLSTGEMIEAAMVGRDGVLGAASALDGKISLSRAMVQLPGQALVCELGALKDAALQSPSLLSLIIRHEQALYAQSQQSTACMAAHDIQSRFCRWLLRGEVALWAIDPGTIGSMRRRRGRAAARRRLREICLDRIKRIVPDGQITSDFQKLCQAPFAKIFRFAPGPNQFTDSPRLVPTRGADRASSRNAGRDAVDAAASGEQVRAGRMALTRTAKSCGSDAPMPASSLREAAQATVSNKPGHREEHEVSRKTIARGMPGNSGVTVVTTLVCLFFYTRDCGCIGRPAFPAPSVQRGEWFLQNFGRIAPRDRDALSNAV